MNNPIAVPWPAGQAQLELTCPAGDTTNTAAAYPAGVVMTALDSA